MHLDARVEGAQLARVRAEVRGGGVAEVEGLRAVVGELVRGGAADAEGGVGAWGMGVRFWGRGRGGCFTGDDGDFAFDSSVGGFGQYCPGVWQRRKKGMAYGPAESGAIWRILGMFSKVPGLGVGTTRCSLSCWRRRLGADDMAGRVLCTVELLVWFREVWDAT